MAYLGLKGTSDRDAKFEKELNRRIWVPEREILGKLQYLRIGESYDHDLKCAG